MSTDIFKPRKKSLVEEPVQKIIIGVAGGSAAGKTTLCDNIFRQMAFDRNFKVEVISLDSFYKSNSLSIQMSIKHRSTSPSITSTTPMPWISISPIRPSSIL